jgi:endonuclease/exonuclease/phosphatase (EEP) superfamily protein YafD
MPDVPLLPPEPAAPPPAAPSPPASAQPKRKLPLRIAFTAASLAVLAGASALLLRQPDELAALTVLPPWCWPLPGLLLAALGARAAPRLLTVLAALAWAGFVLVFCEEPGDALRRRESPSQEWISARADGRALRVVTVNAGGRIEAVDEAFAQDPDLVLVQESPSERKLAELAARRYGPGAHLAWGADTSILGRGDVASAGGHSPGSHVREALVRFRSGPNVRAFSIRLLTPPARLDLWRPAAWTECRDHRRAQRRQVADLAARLAELPPGDTVLVGGDWNAPARDRIFRVLPPTLRDLWTDGGSGFGNTVLGGVPIHRIDRIFAGPGVSATAVRARTMSETDHRAVTADVLLDAGAATR